MWDLNFYGVMVLFYVIPISYVVPGYLTPVTVYYVVHVYNVIIYAVMEIIYVVLNVTFNLVVFYGVKEKTPLKFYGVGIYDA